MENEQPVVWILVDHSSREAAFHSVAEHLDAEGVEAHIVTISEVLGSVAREALAGGAERLLRGLRVAVRGRSGDEDFIGAVRRARPDVLAVTDARYVRPLGLLESITGIESLQVGVLADFNLSQGWTRTPLQAFIVPHEEFRERLVAEGFAAERVLVAGPPIQKGFAREIVREDVRKEFGFEDERVVLVRAESFEPGLLEKLVFQATLIDTEARFVFHHDGDQNVAAVLRRAAAQYGLGAAMFGKVDDLERYVAAADLVIASPREPYLAEIVAVDCPILFVGPELDAREQLAFLSRQKAAGHIADVLRLGGELDRYLTQESLDAMRASAAELLSTTSSRDVAQALATVLEHRHDWRKAAFEPAPAPEGDDAPEEQAPDSPFETIGDKPASKSDPERGDVDSDFTGLSRAEAKEQLAALIMTERDLERQLSDAEKQQQRWRNRLEMAREWKEDDLAAEAEGILRGYMDEAERLQNDLRSIRRQKDKLKAAARGEGPVSSGAETPAGVSPSRVAEMERRFRKMEVDSDLDDLKDRIRRELGES